VTRGRPRRRDILLLSLLAFALLTPTAAANGDPASDVLLTSNVYLPYDAPSLAAKKAVERAVDAVYARHFRVKLAVIATQDDLGNVAVLWGRPGQYARFLGAELESLYAGPLLIVMPAGFGIYDGGRPVTAEERVLEGATIKGSDSDSLTLTAADVVTRLLRAGALRSKDIKAPFATAYSATVRRGTTARLRFGVSDDSAWSRIVARVVARSRVVTRLRTPLLRLTAAKPVSLQWKVPRKLPKNDVRVCVVAVDGAGNRSLKACTAVTVAS
jgi:hypothetical protein